MAAIIEDGEVIFTTVGDVAALFGVSRTAVRDWQNKKMPFRKRGGRKAYVLSELMPWFIEVVIPSRSSQRQQKTERIARELQEKEQALKERKILQQIRAEELKYAEKIRELMPREHVKAVFMRAAEQYRNAGELLAKHHGGDAQQILLDAIDSVDKDLETLFDPT